MRSVKISGISTRGCDYNGVKPLRSMESKTPATAHSIRSLDGTRQHHGNITEAFLQGKRTEHLFIKHRLNSTLTTSHPIPTMGAVLSFYDACWPPKAKWSVEKIPDLSGKIVIVTGGNSGIGKETVKALLAKNAKVYIASHNRARVEAAMRELEQATGNKALFIELNLSSLSSVKAAAEAFQRLETKLDILINNAGVMSPPIESITAEGYDLQFGLNVVGHYYFTRLLTPQLIAAGSARIVTLTSHGHSLTDGIKWETLKDGPARQKEKPFDLYNQSKFGNVVVACEFARRYGDKGIISTSVHPGLIVTNLGRTMSPAFVKFAHYLSYSATKGALTSLYAATSQEALNANGKYFTPWARIGKAHPAALDAEVGAKLWAWLEEETKNVQ
ncbi:NAD(P)-binding protein [Mycena venus]|uniref:NAD(P)-binding protein n=1 Tax=Mycena venus TaxID=2733690 RepID=A0A8H7CB86_9AGAR|nr:NAD(P)-binding protein [Mycena venus]